jgi:hypothetical protein
VSTRALRCVFLVARGRRFARRQPVGALVATLVEFLAPPRLTHSPPRRVGRPEVPPFSSRGVMQADVTELDRPGRDKPQLVVLGGSVSFVSTGFKHWEIFTVGSVSFVSKVFGRFAFCSRPNRSSALPSRKAAAVLCLLSSSLRPFSHLPGKIHCPFFAKCARWPLTKLTKLQ